MSQSNYRNQRTRPSIEQLKVTVQKLSQQSKILVIDLEATCTEDSRFKESFQSEILEFGMCVLDLKASEGSELQYIKKQVYVKPQVSAVTDFCTKLTGISYDTVRDALPYEKAILEVRDFIAQNPEITHWGSFGQYDANKIDSQSKWFSVFNPVARLSHFNVKDLSWADLESNKSPGLDYALKLRGMKMEGRHHSGVDDAYNIARILNVLIGKYAHNVV